MSVVILQILLERSHGKEIAEKKFRWDDILGPSVKKKVWIALHESWGLPTLAKQRGP
jgi:hypothetical protein